MLRRWWLDCGIGFVKKCEDIPAGKDQTMDSISTYS